MKEHTLYFILLCLVTIVIYAGYMQATVYGQEKLKFNTKETREMWYACSRQFQAVAPQLHEITRIYLCDCYTDHMRINYTPDEVKALTREESQILGQKFKEICPIPTPQPTIDT